jgi:photosystem II stability/assembly factor-like uncharacterized protein
MRDMRRLGMPLIASLFVVLAAAIFLRAGGSDGSWWSVQTSGIDTNLRGISIGYEASSGNKLAPVIWACGSNGVILQSIDRGKSWKRIHVPSGDVLDFRSIQAFDAKTAYVMSIGEGDKSRIFKTVDGGETWSLQYTDKRSAFFLDALICISKTRCFAVGDPIDGKFLLLTTVNGKDWQELPRDKMPAALPEEGAFAASGTCLAIYGDRDLYIATGGPAARVFHSPDLGQTWTVAEIPIASGTASSGSFSLVRAGDSVVAVGGDYKEVKGHDRVAAYSLDQGATWHAAAQQPGGFRSAVAWVPDSYWMAVGPEGEDVSIDQGVHWSRTGSLNLNAVSVATNFGGVWAVGPKGMIVHLEYKNIEKDPGRRHSSRPSRSSNGR